MLFNEKLIQPRFGLKKVEIEDDEMKEDKIVIIAGFGRVGSTIGRFLQANGEHATYLILDPDNVELLRNTVSRKNYASGERGFS